MPATITTSKAASISLSTVRHQAVKAKRRLCAIMLDLDVWQAQVWRYILAAYSS